jgi:hypothetical protein
LHRFGQPHPMRLAQVQVKVTQVQQRVAVEDGRPPVQHNLVATQPQIQAVALAAPAQADG